MFSALLVLLVITGLGLSLFLVLLLFLNPKNYQISFKDSTILIVKIVELHRENLPLNSAHGWNLIPSDSSLRCWKKELPFHVTGDSVTVFACSKQVSCAAVILLNVIADVSTWSEWDVQVQEQIVHLELPDNPSLHGDRYMQCDQVLISSKAQAKPQVEMFRFGNLESNGVGWILLWNANKLDWTLYIAQPISDQVSVSDGEIHPQETCMLTAMWGCEVPPTARRPSELCQKVLNLSEAISFSQMKLRPFQSLRHPSSMKNPHFPTIHSALEDLPRKPCVLLEHDKDKCLPLQNGALGVVPLSPKKPLALRDVSGFVLVLSQLKKASGEGPEEKRRSRRRQKLRSDSMSSGFPRMKLLDIENKRSSSLTTPARKKPPELTVTQADDAAPQPPQRAASHSFLQTLFPRRWSSNDVSDRSRSPSPSRTSKRRFFGFQKTSSLSSQEDVSSRSSFQDLDLSDNETGTEFLVAAHSLQNESADFKSIGEYSISAVLQENLKAAMADIKVSEEEQKKLSGGWIFKDMNKNIAVFKKTTHLDSCVFISHLSKGVLPTPLGTVWKTLCNPQTRFMYDDTIKKLSILYEYPSGQKLIHMYNESVTLLHKEVRDFCILQTEKVEGSKFILGFHSVKDSNCPPLKDVTRGTVVASGWVVEPVSEDDTICQVSYLIQMIVSSPESGSIEEMSNMQSQCIHNLSLYLTSKPPTHLPLI